MILAKAASKDKQSDYHFQNHEIGLSNGWPAEEALHPCAEEDGGGAGQDP